MAEDNSWVFESLVCFLNGPVWNAPLQSFIEEKSLIFEPNVVESENYSKIFDEYRNLVDLMLGSYMEDIGINPNQFEDACNNYHKQMLPKHFDQQIWAANDYELFKRMMTQRNVELQLQALEIIEQKYGVTPQSFIPHKRQTHRSGETQVEVTTEELKNCKLEEEVLKDVLEKFSQEDSNEMEHLLEEKHIIQEELKSTMENISHPSSIEEHEEIKDSLTELPKPSMSNQRNTKDFISKPTNEEIRFDKKPITSEVSSTELDKRREYLRAQRDKLVALKKEARKKHLGEGHDGEKTIKERPKSAKAAKAVLEGTATPNISKHDLQVRKTLAERLRSEVIAKKEGE